MKYLSRRTATNLPRRKYRAIAAAPLVAGALIISACGGSGGGEEQPPTPDPIVNDTSTDDLKASASGNVGGSLDSSLDGFSRVSSEGDSPDDTFVGGLWGDDAQSLINTSLDLGDDSNTVREGSRITIDPDDAAVCSEQLVDMSADSGEFQRCQALVAQMTVQIDATSDTDGTMTYLFQNRPLAIMDYTVNSSSFELNLGTLKSLIDEDRNLSPEGSEDSPLDILTGAIKVAALATNTAVGSEAGSVSLDVTQAIQVASADAGTDLSLGVGTIVAMSADAADESASIELAVGAIQASFPGDEAEDVVDFDMAGLTAIIDLSNESDQLTVRNLGVGNGPLRMLLNNSEVVNLGLDTFGFTVQSDETSGDAVFTINGQLNLSAIVREVTGSVVSDTFFTMVEMTAPAGTQLLDNGPFQVLSGGPVMYSLTTQDDNGDQVVEQVTVDAGQCADEVQGFDDDGVFVDEGLQIVDCF